MVFDFLQVLDDPEPRSETVQMAIDETLLNEVSVPTLRIYRWLNPCVSIGYFQEYENAAFVFEGLPIVRRWTGGGCVVHGNDWPYSLIVPHKNEFCRIRPEESYTLIHSALQKCLTQQGLDVWLAADKIPESNSRNCFEAPVRADLLLEGIKVAGAGQRRNKKGLLHQGSVLIPKNNSPDTDVFASILSLKKTYITLSSSMLLHAERLAIERYNTSGWTKLR